MRKMFAVLSCLALVLSLSANALACNNSEGDLYSADASKQQVTIKLACGSEETYTLKKETKITLNGKSVALSDLSAGDKLKIAHESKTDVLSISATRA